MQVGWLGLGAMGAPMAARAARAGHVVRGYDVVPARAASLAADGVRPVDTVAAAVSGTDLATVSRWGAWPWSTPRCPGARPGPPPATC